MVKGTVSITLEDFQALMESAERAQITKNSFNLAKKELQVFLSFLATRADLEKYIDEFNRQSKTSNIIFEGTSAKIELKNA
jgi:chitinase